MTARTRKAYVGFGLLVLTLLIIYLFDPKKPIEVEKLGLNSVSVCFSPNGNCEQLIVNAFKNAKTDISAAVYTFTSYPIATELINAKKRGIIVRVILDADMGQDRTSRLQTLKNSGIDVILDSDNNSIMHNKYAVVDEDIVITGSYNWTTGANNSNYENLTIIQSKELANKFIDNFNVMWDSFIK